MAVTGASPDHGRPPDRGGHRGGRHGPERSARGARGPRTAPPRERGPRVLVARLDSDGDVLLAGPAVRAVAAGASHLTLLCGPAGERAARQLPGVDDVLRWRCPWIDADPPPVRGPDVDGLVSRLAGLHLDSAVVLTSFHQSALPLALLLRLAGVPRIAAASTDYAGTLLDVRLRPGEDFPEDLPEPERALLVADAAGFPLPGGDDGRLAVLPPPPVRTLVDSDPYVVMHPGASAPARRWPSWHWREAARRLALRGHRVVVTGGPGEIRLTREVAGDHATDLGGRTSFPQLSGLVLGASAVVVGNTGPAHLAAAHGTPVVSLFAPVVPARRWAPYRVPTVLLGDQRAPCAGSRARHCPVPGHPCLSDVAPEDVVRAVQRLVGRPTHQVSPRAGVARPDPRVPGGHD
ncbi:glycosyltransferase family 9 protein [Actinoalloteichus caeruleus]|uniref:glycosyltransferase family 9 protein n=1 Tax=Actinoalloteichus cyanogriseus TaxID=2893586 RepID=UPI0004AA548D